MKITFSTTPKPFNDSNIVRQTNCLRSIVALDVDKEILLFGEQTDSIAQDLCRDLGINFIYEYRRSEMSGIPFVNDLFSRTENFCESDFYCYTNCDMIYLQDFVDTVNFFNELKTDKKKFMCGARWDTNEIKQILDFQSLTSAEIKEMTRIGERHSSFGIDYFIFQKNTFMNMPDFMMARAKFDNFILSHAIDNPDILEVNASNTISAIHQNHHYGVNSDLDADTNWENLVTEFDYNASIENKHYNRIASIDGCYNNTILNQNEIRLKQTGPKAWWENVSWGDIK